MSRQWTTGCGIFLIVVGGILALVTLGVIEAEFWAVALAAFLIGVGALSIWAATRRGAPSEMAVDVPLQGAAEGRVVVRFGAGRLRIGAGASAANLVELRGDIPAGYRTAASADGRKLEVVISVDALAYGIPPWSWVDNRPPEWDVRLAKGVPLELRLESGACEARLDLTDLDVRVFGLSTGASDTEVRMPAAPAHRRAAIRLGAGAVRMILPDGVAGRILTRTGLGDVAVDRIRFPRVQDGFESPGYATAENRTEIQIDLGAASVDVR